jgi:ribosomal-protein-alanine N-acetyltransferase
MACSKGTAARHWPLDQAPVILFLLIGMEAAMGLKRTNQQPAANSNLPTTDASRTQIRWLIRRDMDEVLSIERASFQFPWTEEEFLCCLRQRNCIGTVAELDHRIVGFMIYELHKSMLRILNFAVAPDARRSGIGRQMVQRLIDKLSQQRRREIVLEVRETNVPAQLFFSNNGFRAITVLRKHYDDTCEDAYYMRYCMTEDGTIPFIPHNRISEYDAA